MPGWVSDAWQEYARRLPPELPLELHEVAVRKRGRNPDIERLRRDEGRQLLAAASGQRLIALDGRGKAMTTEQLAARLEHWMGGGQDCAFLVGGPDGLSGECLEAADERWSLGPLTFPHPLVRVILAEQLYRAWTVTRNHPYHRA
jgi:23S rRNA (pseudouridine1915-N3)-methyltransferase